MGKININLNDYMEHMSDAQQEIFKRDIKEYVASRMQVIELRETIKKYGGIDTPFFKRYSGTPKVQSIMSKYATIVNKMQQQYPEFYRDFRREVMTTSTKSNQDNYTRPSDVQHLSKEIARNIVRQPVIPIEQQDSNLINDITTIKSEGKIKRSEIEREKLPNKMIMKLKVTQNRVYINDEHGDKVHEPMRYRNQESKDVAIRKYVGDITEEIDKKYVNPSILKVLSRIDRGSWLLPFHYLNIINGGGINGVSLEESQKKFREKIRMICTFDDRALFEFEEKRTARYAKKVGIIDELRGISEKSFWDKLFGRDKKDTKALNSGNPEAKTAKTTASTTSADTPKQKKDKGLADRVVANQDAQKRIEEVLKQYQETQQQTRGKAGYTQNNSRKTESQR